MKESELKDIVRKGFDEAAPGYDKPAMRFFKDSADYLASFLTLRGDERILDIATGTGNAALALAARVKNGSVAAFDLSPGMIAQAQGKARAAGLRNLSFECRDIEAASYPDDHFDLICCSFGVFFWTDMEKNLRRLRAWLKPDGSFVMTSFAAGSFLPQSELALKRFQAYGVRLPETYSWQRLDSVEKHRALLGRVGFCEQTTEVRPMGYPLSGPEEWWDLITFTGFRSFLNQLRPVETERYKREHLEEIAKAGSTAGIPLRVDVIFSAAKKSLQESE